MEAGVCRGPLRAWTPFRPMVAADDMKAMFGNSENIPGTKKTISIQYEIHNVWNGTSELHSDSVDISVAIYERSKYKWQTLDFKMLADYWTGGIYKTSPTSCVLIVHDQGSRPFGRPYKNRRASDVDMCSKDVEHLKEKGFTFPRTVALQLMVDGQMRGQEIYVTLAEKDKKVQVPSMFKMAPEIHLTEYYDCGYTIVSSDRLIKMISSTPPPVYPDPEVLKGALYKPEIIGVPIHAELGWHSQPNWSPAPASHAMPAQHPVQPLLPPSQSGSAGTTQLDQMPPTVNGNSPGGAQPSVALDTLQARASVVNGMSGQGDGQADLEHHTEEINASVPDAEHQAVQAAGSQKVRTAAVPSGSGAAAAAAANNSNRQQVGVAGQAGASGGGEAASSSGRQGGAVVNGGTRAGSAVVANGNDASTSKQGGSVQAAVEVKVGSVQAAMEVKVGSVQAAMEVKGEVPGAVNEVEEQRSGAGQGLEQGTGGAGEVQAGVPEDNQAAKQVSEKGPQGSQSRSTKGAASAQRTRTASANGVDATHTTSTQPSSAARHQRTIPGHVLASRENTLHTISNPGTSGAAAVHAGAAAASRSMSKGSKGASATRLAADKQGSESQRQQQQEDAGAEADQMSDAEAVGVSRYAVHDQPGYVDVMVGPRPGGDTKSEPCYICQKRRSVASNMIYLCENECGWGAHHKCLKLPAGTQAPEVWFCSLGCEKAHMARTQPNAEDGKQQPSDEPATAPKTVADKLAAAEPPATDTAAPAVALPSDTSLASAQKAASGQARKHSPPKASTTLAVNKADKLAEAKANKKKSGRGAAMVAAAALSQPASSGKQQTQPTSKASTSAGDVGMEEEEGKDGRDGQDEPQPARKHRRVSSAGKRKGSGVGVEAVDKGVTDAVDETADVGAVQAMDVDEEAPVKEKPQAVSSLPQSSGHKAPGEEAGVRQLQGGAKSQAASAKRSQSAQRKSARTVAGANGEQRMSIDGTGDDTDMGKGASNAQAAIDLTQSNSQQQQQIQQQLLRQPSGGTADVASNLARTVGTATGSTPAVPAGSARQSSASRHVRNLPPPSTSAQPATTTPSLDPRQSAAVPTPVPMDVDTQHESGTSSGPSSKAVSLKAEDNQPPPKRQQKQKQQGLAAGGTPEAQGGGEAGVNVVVQPSVFSRQLPIPVFNAQEHVTLESRLAILGALARMLRDLGHAKAARQLVQVFRSADEEEGTLQVTYHYTEVQLLWEARDVPGIMDVFRDRYRINI